MLVVITSHPIQYQAPLWRAMAQAGLDFEVWFLTPHAVAPSFDREFGQSFAWDVDLLGGYRHRFMPVAPGWNLKRFNGIRLCVDWTAEFRKTGVTHVWVEGWRFRVFWDAIRTAHRLGLSVWLRGENHALGAQRWSTSLWKRPLLRWLFRHVDHFLCIGQANRQYYAQHGVDVARLHHAPYCVDNEYFRRTAAALSPERATLRARWEIRTDDWCVLFCGKLIEKKRPFDLLAAARLVPVTLRSRLHLLFAGDGELRERLVTAAAAEPALRVCFAGFLNQSAISQAFAAADCLVLPSDAGETWGLVVNEALASGLPVIVSDQCGCAGDLAAPLGPEHVYPCGDVIALAARLAAVTQRPPNLESIHQLIDGHAPAITAATARTLLRT